jgi:hypothetical protein
VLCERFKPWRKPLTVFFGKKVALDLDYVLHRLNMTQAQFQRNRRLAEALAKGLREIEELAHPTFFYKEKRILTISPGQVQLEGSYVLESNLLSDKLSDAQCAFVGIVTIGKELEVRTKAAKIRNGLTYAFAFESLALVAIDMTAKDFFLTIEEELKEKGLYLGVPLSPGESIGWPIKDQRTIFEMVKDEVKGLSITETNLLLPKNSASFVVGVYDHPVREEGETNCSYCSMRERCMYRKRE